MPYAQWKALYQQEASTEQQKDYEQNKPKDPH